METIPVDVTTTSASYWFALLLLLSVEVLTSSPFVFLIAAGFVMDKKPQMNATRGSIETEKEESWLDRAVGKVSISPLSSVFAAALAVDAVGVLASADLLASVML